MTDFKMRKAPPKNPKEPVYTYRFYHDTHELCSHGGYNNTRGVSDNAVPILHWINRIHTYFVNNIKENYKLGYPEEFDKYAFKDVVDDPQYFAAHAYIEHECEYDGYDSLEFVVVEIPLTVEGRKSWREDCERKQKEYEQWLIDNADEIAEYKRQLGLKKEEADKEKKRKRLEKILKEAKRLDKELNDITNE